MTSVALLDYGAGNLHSARRALERAGADVAVAASPGDVGGAAAVVVPGVGHFGACVRRFREAGMDLLVRDWAGAGRPVLGVCVGMQILYDASEEDPGEPGLGLLPGVVRRLPAGLNVPHMGWNTIHARRDDPLVAGVDGAYVYFVHSYAAEPREQAHVVADCDYGRRFPAVVRAGSVTGTQFHPEKSAEVGARLLASWVREVGEARG